MSRIATASCPDAWVVGAGWAGLAAAAGLVRAGWRVGLLEATAEVGGRARDVRCNGAELDYGQHLVLGAYTRLRELLTLAGAQAARGLRPAPLHMIVRDQGQELTLHVPLGAGRVGRIAALLRAASAGGRSRLGLLGALVRLGPPPDAGQTVGDWLRQRRQPAWLRRQLWNPLCLAALNTPPDTASAQVFARVLRDSFGGPSGASDWLMPTAGLGRALARPVYEGLRASGRLQPRWRCRVSRLAPGSGGVGPVLANGETLPPAPTILAVPPVAAAGLLAELPATAELAGALNGWSHADITTLYLGLSAPVRLPAPWLGLTDGPLEWLIDRTHCGQPDILAGVISADTDRRPGAQRYPQMLDQLRRNLPGLDQPRWYRLVRARRATFDCSVTTAARRPGVKTAQSGLWLAGDYIDTGLPATLEGAVRAGFQAAESAIAEGRRT